MLQPIVLGGLAAGAGDSILAVVLYRVSLGIVYRSVASGLLGRSAYAGGLGVAVLGCALHFAIAAIWAAVYVIVARRLPVLVRQPVWCGLAFGVVVYLAMKCVVLPLSAVPRLTPLDLWAMGGHALLVGVPIALAAAYGRR